MPCCYYSAIESQRRSTELNIFFPTLILHLNCYIRRLKSTADLNRLVTGGAAVTSHTPT